MKNYQTSNIRNIVLVGAPGAGKTTLAEAMAFEGKAVDRRGSIENDSTLSDSSELEHYYKRSIYPSLLYAEFNNHKINFIDAPGSDDYCGGVFSAYKVVDTAVMVFNGSAGFEPGGEVQDRYAAIAKKPVIGVINQLDKENANFEGTIEGIREGGKLKPVIVQYPLNPGTEFNTIIDVLTRKMYTFKDENGTVVEADVPASEADKVDELYNNLVEAAAENDEELMEKFFETGELTIDEVRRGMRLGVATRDFMPIFCASAKKCMGIKRLFEFIINVAQSPLEANTLTDVDGNVVKADADAPASLFVYKSAIEHHVGEVTFFRVVSGKVTESMDVTNPKNGNKEKISQIFAPAGKNRVKVTELAAGDLGCTVKLKATKTNDTLAVSGSAAQISPVDFPESRYRAAVRAVEQSDEEKLGEWLNKAKYEDPSYVVEYSKELKQVIVNGQSEMHLNTLKTSIKNAAKIDIEFFAPKIPYRETITKVAVAEYRHKKQSGGAGQFGEVHMIIEPFTEGMPEPSKYKIAGKDLVMNIKDKQEYPLDWGGKLQFYSAIVGGAIDANFMPSILKGIMSKMDEGPLTGSYARDIRVIIFDGKMHPVDSKPIAFEIAGRNAFKIAFRSAGPKIMEPIYDVEVLVPSEDMGDVMSDLNNRRATIMGMHADGAYSRLSARVPLAELYRYSTSLNAMSSGRATYTMKFSAYEQVPSDVQEKLLKEYQDEDKDE
ncbi:MAG: elongation factor G [Tidjanibacter sp.]|nr:elongation factor G [Tidjanibacter sp.]